LKDRNPGVRENAVRLAEQLLASSETLTREVTGLTGDRSPRVRFQCALSAGAMPPKAAAVLLQLLLDNAASDFWTETAALTSASQCGTAVLRELAERKIPNTALITRVAALVGAKGDRTDIFPALRSVADGTLALGVDAAILNGLGQGMRNSKMPLAAWLATPPAGSESLVTALQKRFTAAGKTVKDEKATAGERVSATTLLAYAPFELAGPALAEALSPNIPGDVQLAAVRALATHTDPKVAELLLKHWKGYGPSIRVAVLDALLARPERVLVLLAAVEKKHVEPAAISPAQVQQLKAHPNAGVKGRAAEVFKQAIDADRAKVVASFNTALDLKGDAKAGKPIFQKHCAACHKLDGVGHDVGANLLATLGSKSGDDLLAAVFDPNREVDPRYVSYLVGTADGRILTGVIVAETPTSVTLRRAEGVEDVILRANLETFRATSLSLMPAGFEKELKPQDVADLFAYLRTAGK
jgi:putative heme-binding domain-containing protein